jgi:hypothetical protein
VGFPSRASEFPNDNAEISSGGIWVCALTGAAHFEGPPYEPVRAEPFVLYFDEDEVYVDGPVDLQISPEGLSVKVHAVEDEAEDELELELGAPSPEIVAESDAGFEAEREVEPAARVQPESPIESTSLSAAAESPAFTSFESALVGALMAHGASRAATLVPRLLRLEPLPAESLAKDVQLTLQSRGYLDGSARYSTKYRDLCGAWAAVLRGSSQDFSACGTTTLDRFGAELLAALLAVPATRTDELRRELRKAGIAAFGVLEAA